MMAMAVCLEVGLVVVWCSGVAANMAHGTCHFAVFSDMDERGWLEFHFTIIIRDL